ARQGRRAVRSRAALPRPRRRWPDRARLHVRRRLGGSAPIVIVAGHITVDREQRESYLAGSVSVVDEARAAAGCLDFAITPDLIALGRVNPVEHWESQTAVKAFCRRRPRTSKEQQCARRR